MFVSQIIKRNIFPFYGRKLDAIIENKQVLVKAATFFKARRNYIILINPVNPVNSVNPDAEVIFYAL